MSRLAMRGVAVCVLGALLLAGAGAGGAAARGHRGSRARLSAQCAYADTPVGSVAASVMRTAVVCLLNQQRAAHGLPRLRPAARLNGVAESHTQAMVVSGVFSHGGAFAVRFTAGGYDWRAAAENIASGYATPRSVVAGWMASQDHCRNILSPLFRDVGTGVSAGSVGLGVGEGTWTEDFGVLMSQSFPSSNTGPQNGCPYPSS